MLNSIIKLCFLNAKIIPLNCLTLIYDRMFNYVYTLNDTLFIQDIFLTVYSSIYMKHDIKHVVV